MAKKTQRQLADEAYLRGQQVTIDHRLAEEQPTRVYPKLDGVPAACPECAAKWTVEYGVAPIIRPNQQQTVFLEQIQCGKCGNIFLLDPADHAALVQQRKTLVESLRAARAPLPKPKRGKRERGAG